MSNTVLRLMAVTRRARLCVRWGAAAGAVGIVFAAAVPARAADDTFTTPAGVAGVGSSDGTGSAARFNLPTGIALDSAGTAYVADAGNSTIRKITPDGVVSTLAGLAGTCANLDGTGSAARFCHPSGVAVDGTGNVYVADTDAHTIRMITPDGVVSTLAGLAFTPGSTPGIGSVARFNSPTGVAVDGAGTVFVADSGNHTIRQVTPGVGVSTTAGAAGESGASDGEGSVARFDSPRGVAVDSTGAVYVADTGNSTVRKITWQVVCHAPGGCLLTPVVRTLAGLAGDCSHVDATGSAARFCFPAGVAVDGAGTVYVANRDGQTIRTITPPGTVSTLAGLPFIVGGLDGTGSAARFFSPQGVAVDSSGIAYVADTGNSAIRKITPAGVVTTFAGVLAAGSADGVGSAARFTTPRGIAITNAGVAYVADSNNQTIRKITPAGLVSTLAGSAGSCGNVDGVGGAARFCGPSGVAVDHAGNVYVADTLANTIRKITLGGAVSTLAGQAFRPGSVDGTGINALFNAPTGVAVDDAGTVYVADSGNSTIRKIAPDGFVSTWAGVAGVTGSMDGIGTEALFNHPMGIAVDGSGVAVVADTFNHTLRQIGWVGVGPHLRITIVGTLAGLAGTCDIADGNGSAARFCGPEGVALDGSGTIYVADSAGETIRTLRAGVVTTLAGLGFVAGSADGPGSVARFNFPTGIAVTRDGALYVADTANNTIRRSGKTGSRVVADFDGDGRSDITVYRPATGTWFTLQSSTATLSTVAWGISTDVPVPGDYDGDGKIDIAVYRPSSGSWYIWQSSTSTLRTVTLGASTDVPVPADYDGDGQTDIAVYRPDSGTWYVLQSSNLALSTVSWGSSSDVSVPGDFDGDGKADIAVYRPGTGTWYILQSSNSSLSAVSWGSAGTDVPVVGDYDGDGMTDIAVYRPSTGQWFIRRSSTLGPLTVTWGISTDVPVPADYDGDGTTDIAVYRPGTGTWYILQSSTLTPLTVAWGSRTDIPVLKRP